MSVKKSGRYDLHMKVEGRLKPFYVVRRRTIDGGFECSCPRWVEAREECRHVAPVREALSNLTQAPALERKIRDTIDKFPYFIQQEDRLIDMLVQSVLSIL